MPIAGAKRKGHILGYLDVDLVSACPNIGIFLPWPKRLRGIKYNATGVNPLNVPNVRLEKKIK